MKNLYHELLKISCLVLAFSIPIAPMFWVAYRPEIQTALRTIQNLIFWWQQ